MNKQIIIFGYGYVSQFLIQQLQDSHWIIYCTSRNVPLGKPVSDGHVTIIHFLDPNLSSIIASSHILLNTIPPNNEGRDPVLNTYKKIIAKTMFEWIGYLSSTSVYGNHHGAWVDEDTKCLPRHQRSKIRLFIEQEWLELYAKYERPVHIFRLSGIYGPKRNCLEHINNGKDFTIVKKEHSFSRIHVADICMAIIASIQSPAAGEIYNVSDDEPAPINIVQQFGAALLNKSALKEIACESADLSDQAKSFFNDSKKISNRKIKEQLKISWRYPNYQMGLLKGCLPYLHISAQENTFFVDPTFFP
jgi:dTDP-D-glucose 4,6-dehydratase